MKSLPMLIGSRAMDYWHADGRVKSLYLRGDSDWDFLTEEPERLPKEISGNRVECHSFDMLNNQELYSYFYSLSDLVVVSGVGECLVAPLLCLYVLKRSHAWRVQNFNKTMGHLW